MKYVLPFFMMLALTAPAWADDEAEHIALNGGDTLILTAQEHYMWSDGYRISLMKKGSAEAKSVAIEDLNKGKIDTIDILQSSNTPEYEPAHNLLHVSAHIGPDFFCDNDYQPVAKGDQYRLTLQKQHCYKLDPDTGKETVIHHWNRPKAN